MPNKHVRRIRETIAPMRRFARMEDAEVTDDGLLRLVASTDAPVRMGNWREVLVHTEAAIDRKGAHSLLINHDPNQIAGTIRSMRVENGKMEMEVVVDADARLSSGVSVRNAVKNGSLRGVSIGYDYSRDDATYDEQTRTVTVRNWRFLEVTLTPIPADADAGVRSCPFPETRNNPMKNKILLVRLLALAAAFPHLAESLHERAVVVDKDDAEAQAGETALRSWAESQKKPEGGDETTRARDLVAMRERAERAELSARVRSLAAENHIELTDEEVAGYRSLEAASLDLLKRKAKVEATDDPEGPIVRITHDKIDKVRELTTGMLMHRSNLATADERKAQNPLVGMTYLDAARRWGRLMGVRGIEDWSRKDVACFALGDYRNMSETAKRSAANIISSQYANFVTLDAITKVVARGFENIGRGVNYQLWTAPNRVPDFKNFFVGSLGTGNLQETAENESFPELVKSEGVYNSAVKMWGGTLSLSLQAMLNDDTGEFDRSLQQTGPIAQKTINKRAYQKLLRGTATTDASTWTNNTTQGAIGYTTADGSAAARTNLDAVIAGMMNKVGQDGNPLGNVPAFLLCAPTLAGQARGITSGVGPGQQNTHKPTAGDLEVLASPWLTTSSGLTGADSAHYYLLCDPNEVTTMLTTMIGGMETPQVMEFDAGAVAARKWKIFLPFECDLVNQANSAGTTIIAGAQQGTD